MNRVQSNTFRPPRKKPVLGSRRGTWAALGQPGPSATGAYGDESRPVKLEHTRHAKAARRDLIDTNALGQRSDEHAVSTAHRGERPELPMGRPRTVGGERPDEPLETQ